MAEWVPTQTQVSAGGVAFRREDGQVQIALISVGKALRWQLPKGLVNPGETHEVAAQREVREEAGIETELLEPLDKVDYWFSAQAGDHKVRYHKFVHFFLLRYLAGDVSDHDFEVNEARWVEIGQAQAMMSFDSDRKIVAKAAERIISIEGIE